MAGRVGFLPRGFKHAPSTADDDFDAFEPDVDELDGEQEHFSRHTIVTVHDRFYDDEDEFDYRPQHVVRAFEGEKKLR